MNEYRGRNQRKVEEDSYATQKSPLDSVPIALLALCHWLHFCQILHMWDELSEVVQVDQEYSTISKLLLLSFVALRISFYFNKEHDQEIGPLTLSILQYSAVPMAFIELIGKD